MRAWRKVMAAYRRVYDSHHLQGDCQKPDQLRNHTLVNRVWAAFTVNLFAYYLSDDMTSDDILPSVLWCSWLGGRKGIQPVKNSVVGCWHGYLSGARCRLAYGPADATATQLSVASVKSILVYLSVPAHPGSPGQMPLNVCVCVCVCACVRACVCVCDDMT